MKHGWEEVLSLLPGQMQRLLSSVRTEEIRELRFRVGVGIECNYGQSHTFLVEPVNREDIAFIINAASRYSPWQAETICRGYLTARGGHRIGICGEVVLRDGSVQGIRNVDSLCIRIARDVEKIGTEFEKCSRSILLLGPPGSGKTTLLRDIARIKSETELVSVIDEREELFPQGFRRGRRMDILRLCPKDQGIDMVLRTMGPEWICVDEITKEEDCGAIVQAGNCGVRLMATAHAENLADLRTRPIYRSLLEAKVFDNIAVLRKDNTFFWERKEAWS